MTTFKLGTNHLLQWGVVDQAVTALLIIITAMMIMTMKMMINTSKKIARQVKRNRRKNLMMILMMIQIQGVVFSLEALLGIVVVVLTVVPLGVAVAEASTVADLLAVGNVERIIEK